MQIYEIGGESLEYYGLEHECPPNTIWVIHNYDVGQYDGYGKAIAYDGEYLWECDLGHCSCYGPLDDGFSKIGTIEDLFSTSDRSIFDEDFSDEVLNKIWELVNAN